MRTTTIILAAFALALMTMAMIDAAAIKNDAPQIKHLHKELKNKENLETKATNATATNTSPSSPLQSKNNQKKPNPHALSAADKRSSSSGNNDIFRIESVPSNRHLCSGCKACVGSWRRVERTDRKGRRGSVESLKYFFTVFDKAYDRCDVLAYVVCTRGTQMPYCTHSQRSACLFTFGQVLDH